MLASQPASTVLVLDRGGLRRLGGLAWTDATCVSSGYVAGSACREITTSEIITRTVETAVFACADGRARIRFRPYSRGRWPEAGESSPPSTASGRVALFTALLLCRCLLRHLSAVPQRAPRPLRMQKELHSAVPSRTSKSSSGRHQVIYYARCAALAERGRLPPLRQAAVNKQSHSTPMSAL